MTETKITTKGQTTLPNDIRDFLGVNPGDKVEWNTIKGMVIRHAKVKISSGKKLEGQQEQKKHK